MVHLRIIAPPDLTATVLRELAQDPGVTHIAAVRGAATEPPGDLVSCDVVRASVNPLLRRLRLAGVSERGGISLTEPEAVISLAADRARGLGRIPASYLAGDRPLAGLLIGANLGAFVVAFAAGAAGIIALGRAKSGAVVGVLVSITTIPAASNVGVALATGTASEAGHSVLILLLNLAGLLAGGVLTLLGTRVWAHRIEAGQAILRPRPRPGP